MEAEAAYTAARPVVTVPAWRASAEKPDFPAGLEGRTLLHCPSWLAKAQACEKVPSRRGLNMTATIQTELAKNTLTVFLRQMASRMASASE